MKRNSTLASLCIALLTVSGCASSSESSTPSETPVDFELNKSSEESRATPTPSPSPSKNIRGNLEKDLGETAGFLSYSGDTTAVFQIKDFVRNVKCTEPYSEKPENGELVALKISAKTEPSLAEDINGSITFDPIMWKYIDSDGKTFNGDLGTISTYSCWAEKKIISNQIGPGEKVEGWVLLDVPASDGLLVYTLDTVSGWEYDLSKFPDKAK
ncbi:DUF4352 domain-containing protein [Glutamicibacter creatinolyticus]|uniref:DUF4352 domain-containing protein n=1 Tax=Glutamicibacter creatinolyticus TaxID=162496 RepID=UPI001110423E|nr:DUF4352 domain-containing protein [Glutamicibacter creatinolyticus]